MKEKIKEPQEIIAETLEAGTAGLRVAVEMLMILDPKLSAESASLLVIKPVVELIVSVCVQKARDKNKALPSRKYIEKIIKSEIEAVMPEINFNK